MTTRWTAEQVARIDLADAPLLPVISRRALDPILPGIDLWDHWPVQEEDGRVAEIAGGRLVMLLSAPVMGDPDARHAIARIRLMHQRHEGDWRDLGPLLPDGFSPGSREWAGSAIIDRAHEVITLHFTAAGRRGEERVSFAQRLFETRALLGVHGDAIGLGPWSEPVETVVNDGSLYVHDLEGGGAIGTIKAFRDPAWFRDPADGTTYLLFSASLTASKSAWNGAIGIARREAQGGWALLPPLVDADGLNNELERPHIVMHGGRYHLFWSTQRKVFAAGGPAGPNGLYGMVADNLFGPWRPLNGTGLVLANPPQAPFQAYSWFVCDDLGVCAFADILELDRLPVDAAEARAHFGGTPAPTVRLAINGDRAMLA